MASATGLADRNHLSTVLPWAPSHLRGSNLNQVATEETVTSGSSSSRNNTHSARSTSASSFSIQRACSNAGVQASDCQSGEDIELPSISRHGNPSDNPPQPHLEDSIEPHNSSVITNEEQNESGNTLEPSNPQWSYTTSFQDSLRTALPICSEI